MTNQVEATAARVRRVADRQGLKLHKLRCRDDEYIVTDVESSGLVFPFEFGWYRGAPGATLDEVRDYLTA